MFPSWTGVCLQSGWSFGSEHSPAEDVPLDAALDLVPRLEDRRAGFDGRDTTFDLFGPLGFCVGVRGAVEAREELSGEFGPCLIVEAQCVGQNCGGCLGHDESILRPGRLPNQALAADSADSAVPVANGAAEVGQSCLGAGHGKLSVLGPGQRTAFCRLATSFAGVVM
jgi:hypothetical protein